MNQISNHVIFVLLSSIEYNPTAHEESLCRNHVGCINASCKHGSHCSFHLCKSPMHACTHLCMFADTDMNPTPKYEKSLFMKSPRGLHLFLPTQASSGRTFHYPRKCISSQHALARFKKKLTLRIAILCNIHAARLFEC